MQVSSSTEAMVRALARFYFRAYLGILVVVILACFIIGAALGSAYPLPQNRLPVTVVKVRQVLVANPVPSQPAVQFEPLALIVSRTPDPPPVEPVIEPQPRPDKTGQKRTSQKKRPQLGRGQVAPTKVVQVRWLNGY